MIGSSTSHGIQLGKRPALSTSLEKAGKKRAAEEDDTHRIIHLTVKGQEKEVHFKVKGNTKLQKILKMFCEKARVEYRTMRFYIDNHSFPLTSTPDELHMSDGDEIEAMGWQTGA